MQLCLFIFLVILVICTNSALCLRRTKCHLLALEGGGTNGAFEAGAFQAMVELMQADDIKYDVIAGVSAGAINGIIASSSKIGNEKEAAKNMRDIWYNIRSGDLFESWFFLGPVRGILDKPSFFDNTPMMKFVQKEFKRIGGHMHRLFTMGIVDAQTGKYLVRNETVGDEHVAEYVTASASVPGVFKYIVHDKHVFIDGGSTDNLNLRGGIAQCKKIVGDDDEAITVDIITCDPFVNIERAGLNDEPSYTIYSRGEEIRGDIKDIWYIKDAIRAFPSINWRYIISPKKSLPNYPLVPLNFNPEIVKKIYKTGYDDATEILKESSGNAKTLSLNARSIKRVKLY